MGELKTMIENLEKWSQPRGLNPLLSIFPLRIIYCRALWVCLQIVPELSFQLSLFLLIGAVAAGNTVVLKPSEHAPKTANLLEKLIAEVTLTLNM